MFMSLGWEKTLRSYKHNSLRFLKLTLKICKGDHNNDKNYM